MQDLPTYLHGKHKGDFARRLGINHVYLSQILSGHRRPSFGLMCRIEEVTDGQVPLAAWRKSLRKSGVTTAK